MAPLAILDSQKKFSALRQQLNILQPQNTCLSSPEPNQTSHTPLHGSTLAPSGTLHTDARQTGMHVSRPAHL